MATVPGHAGLTLVGDRSLEFYRDAVSFVDKRIEQYQSRVFLSRLMNKHTVFVASNAGVREVLEDAQGCLEMGYKSFMGQVYGDNVIFATGADAENLRMLLHGLFSSDTVNHFQETITRLTENVFSDVSVGSPVSVYPIFKRLATEICLSIFLDIDFERSSEIAAKIVALTTTHWHGIISLPLNVKVPMMSNFSYRNALNAKEQLLKIIEEKLANSTSGFPQRVRQCNWPSDDDARHHILLFTSALVPKALASIFTSFLLLTGKEPHLQNEAQSNQESLQHILLETQRLWPPFFGGRRLVRKDVVIDGYKVAAGSAIVYMTRHAQRDGDVFADPDEFVPARWKHANAGDKDKLYVYGGGSRSCVGKHLVDRILQVVTSQLVEKFTWSHIEEQNIGYKWLPVSRPTQGISIVFSPRPVKP